MARKKSTPHRSPNFIGDIDRDIPRTLAPSAITSDLRGQLLGVSATDEMPVPTDWISQDQAARKEQHKRDLEKALRIVAVGTVQGSILGVTSTEEGELLTRASLDWATALLRAEVQRQDDEDAARAAMYEAENETLSADSEGNVIDRRNEISAGARAIFAECVKLAEQNNEDVVAEMNSELSDPPANISDQDQNANSTPKNKGKGKAKAKQPTRRTPRKAAEGPTPSIIQDKIASDPAAARIAAALNSLQYDDNPSDRPTWLTGLHKPLPHPGLSFSANFEIETRMWVDELARLEKQRRQLPAPEAGEWQYEHFGSTVEVVRKEKKGRKKMRVPARGVWRLMVKGKMQRQRLDEFPLDLAGEPLGWGITGVEVEEYRVWETDEEDAGEEEVGGEKEGEEEKKKGKGKGKGKKVAWADEAAEKRKGKKGVSARKSAEEVVEDEEPWVEEVDEDYFEMMELDD